MEFRYKGAEERYLPVLGRTVVKGDVFEATGDTALGLIGQTDLYERTDKVEKKENGR